MSPRHRQTDRQKRTEGGWPARQDPDHNTTRITRTNQLTANPVYPWPSFQVTTTPTCFPCSKALQPQGTEASLETSHREIFTRSSQPTYASTRFAQGSQYTVHRQLDETMVVVRGPQPRKHDDGAAFAPEGALIAAPHGNETAGRVAVSAIESTVRKAPPIPNGPSPAAPTGLCGRSGHHSRLQFAPRIARSEPNTQRTDGVARWYDSVEGDHPLPREHASTFFFFETDSWTGEVQRAKCHKKNRKAPSLLTRTRLRVGVTM